MNIVQNKTFDEERALYGSKDILIKDCLFDGPADGESAFKECSDVQVEHCFFNLRYPFWHDHGLEIVDSEMTELCRAALWYSDHIEISNSRLHGIKALRECREVKMKDCDIVSPEFGWSVRGIKMENCRFDTKDALWHAKNIVVRNSIVKGEYLAWYSENVTFENCRIIGTQPLCYCRGLRLVNCEMTDTDLAFERSEVEADITTPVISIKNPLSGHITVPAVGEVIRDIAEAKGKISVKGQGGNKQKTYSSACA